MSALASLGSVLAALAVAAGAFGAHALRTTLDATMLGVWETAARYHMYHALALFALGLSGVSAQVRGPAWCLGAGILFFSGSLYVMAITGARWLGAITPLGGVCFLVGWLWLAYLFGRRRH